MRPVSQSPGIKFKGEKVTKKILYFSQDYTPHDYRFLAKLAQSPYEVWYLRLKSGPTPPETRPLPSGVKMVEWPGKKREKERGWNKVKRLLDLRRIRRELQPDLIHAGPVQTCGLLVALSGFKPFLLMSWGSDILAKPGQSVLSWLITVFTIRRAGMIACDCLAVRDRIMALAKYPEDRIVVFPWGVDLNQFHSAPSRLALRSKLGWQNKKIVVWTRSLEKIYGVGVFLEAVRRISAVKPDVRFVMLGEGTLRPQVEDFITRHNLKKVIYLAGRVAHDLLPHYFNEADVYASCSYSDGSSVSLLEAMACQLPVVVTDLPANREWVKPGVNGWLTEPGNAKALATALLDALADEERRKSMGEANALVIKERADWDKNFPLLLAAYERLMRDKP